MITDVEIGYISGFLDGEGTVALFKMIDEKRREGYELIPSVKFVNNNRKVLEFIKDKLELDGKIHLIHHSDGHRKDGYELGTCKKKKVIEILEILSPYLIIKNKQAELVIEYCKSREEKPAIKRRNKNGTFSSFIVESYDEKELEIYNRLKILNHRGC
jgi:hypothetical protein